MVGLGTIVNMVAIVLGASVGMILKEGLKQRFQDTIMNALGLAIMFIGLTGSLQGILIVNEEGLEPANIMLMIVSLAIGALIGEIINVEERLENVGKWMKSKIKVVNGERGQSFVDGFVNSSLLFCVGAMAIIGSLQDGLLGDPSMLYAKSFLDGICAMIFTSTLGIGVFFSILPLGLYQGGITASAKYIEPYLNDRLVANISFLGFILIFGIGINMIFGKKIKCGNLLPAILIPVFYEMILNVL